jgi:hypothetical protein
MCPKRRRVVRTWRPVASCARRVLPLSSIATVHSTRINCKTNKHKDRVAATQQMPSCLSQGRGGIVCILSFLPPSPKAYGFLTHAQLAKPEWLQDTGRPFSDFRLWLKTPLSHFLNTRR